MFIRDLQQLTHEDYLHRGYVVRLPAGLPLLAVGWLSTEPPTVGSVPDKFVDRLVHAYEQEWSFSEGLLGYHDCEMCEGDEAHRPDGQIGPIVSWQGRKLRLYGSGCHLVRHEECAYSCPVLILHYVLDHGYAPPDVFVKAVIEGAFLSLADVDIVRNPMTLSEDQASQLRRVFRSLSF